MANIITTTVSPVLAALFVAEDAARIVAETHQCDDNDNARCLVQYEIAHHPAATAGDLSAKLTFMLEQQLGDGMDWLPTILEDVQRIRSTTVAGTDKAILDAFDARSADLAANYFVYDMTSDQEDAYFARLNAHEAVISETPASTVAGIVAKLRIDFMHRVATAWSDHAIMDTSGPEFTEGLAEADTLTRNAWAIIENLARLGGASLTATPNWSEALKLYEQRTADNVVALAAFNVAEAAREDDPHVEATQAYVHAEARLDETSVAQCDAIRALIMPSAPSLSALLVNMQIALDTGMIACIDLNNALATDLRRFSNYTNQEA
ncbi:hypothetical protein U1707_08600 [Sphingomonas sp. PB2P12]|uniref:hypothetical protein n=1 Tax=Sphingomonas sandaracina TaxID=3096157 RepID=UPI002FCACC80